MAEQPEPWNIQGFLPEASGRAMWSVTEDSSEKLLDYLRRSLAETGDDGDWVILIRKGRQVEADDGMIGPYRITEVR